MKRFMTVGSIAGAIFVFIFIFIGEKIQLPPLADNVMSSNSLWGIIFAALFAGIDSIIYKAGQKRTEAAMMYPDVIDGAFIRRNKEKERKNLLKAAGAYSHGKYKSAEVKLNKLLKKCDRNRDFYAVHGLLGMIYNAEDKNEEALEHWKKATEYENGKAYGYSMLSSIYLKLKKYNEAIENGKKALELDEKLYMPKETLCIAYKGIGDEENFTKYYNLVKTYNPFSNTVKERLAAMGK